MQTDFLEFPRFTIDALGIKTSYYESGRKNGRSVLLLHGMTSSGDAYRELMAGLAADYHLVAPDIPGFGFSDMTTPYTMDHLVEWLAAFMHGLDISEWLVIGHSFGGVLATHFTLTYPEDVTRLVLIAPALLSSQKVPEFLMKASISLGLVTLGTTISQSRLVVPYQVKSGFYQPAHQPRAVWRRRLRDYENARASATVFTALANSEIVTDLSKLTHKTCLIWGEDDAVVPIDDGVALASMLPDVELHRLAECGHVPVQEKTAVVVDKIALFLGGG